MGTVRPWRCPHARGDSGKACSGVPARVRPSERPRTPGTRGSGAHSPLRGDGPARASFGACVRARGGAGCCVGRAGARTLTWAPRGRRRWAAARGRRPRVFSGLGGGRGVRPNPESFPAPFRAVPAPQAGRPQPSRSAGTGPHRRVDPRWVPSPLARDGRQVAPKGAASGLRDGDRVRAGGVEPHTVCAHRFRPSGFRQPGCPARTPRFPASGFQRPGPTGGELPTDQTPSPAPLPQEQA